MTGKRPVNNIKKTKGGDEVKIRKKTQEIKNDARLGKLTLRNNEEDPGVGKLCLFSC